MNMKMDTVAFEEMMRKGYEEMAALNLEMANKNLYIENEAEEIIEKYIVED